MDVGIEAMNVYGGQASLDIRILFQARGLDLERFDNLMMQQKSVGMPCEDPVTNAVNAAKPLIEHLSKVEKNTIEMVITATESGLDFGKSLSTYIHDYLGLSRRCRLFEIKQACYGGTAALQMAVGFVLSKTSPGAKVLVIATDVARTATKMTYAEPSQGAAAVAILVSNKPEVFKFDLGANGYYSYEVMDTCRPEAEIETGDLDLSLLSYLDCLEGAFKAYCERVEEVDFQTTFDHLVFHTPFAGMVKGAHRKMMQQYKQAAPEVIEADFQKRVAPSLKYCVQIGNAYSAAAYIALCGLIDKTVLNGTKRVGIYSYGSGCSSEFYSGTITPDSKGKLEPLQIEKRLIERYSLNIQEYEHLLDLNTSWLFGIKDRVVDVSEFQSIYDQQFLGKGLLILKSINHYHRNYIWS